MMMLMIIIMMRVNVLGLLDALGTEVLLLVLILGTWSNTQALVEWSEMSYQYVLLKCEVGNIPGWGHLSDGKISRRESAPTAPLYH